MSIDITTLRLLKYRERYRKLARSVPSRALDPGTSNVLRAFGKFFEDTEAAAVTTPEFMLWGAASYFRKATDESLAKVRAIVELAQEDVPEALAQGLIRRLAEAALAADISKATLAWQDGEEIDLPAAVKEAQLEYVTFASSEGDDPRLHDRIEDLLAEDENHVGVRFRLNCLNQCMRPMRGGDSLLFAARPDRGKGTFIVSEATYWAPQVSALWGPRPIVIMVTEGPGKRGWPRLYSAALGVDQTDLIRRGNAGTLRGDYAAAIGGDPGQIAVVEIHGNDAGTVERKIRRLNPSIVVLDMLANVRWKDAGAGGGTRTDQIIEAQAQWLRELAVELDCVSIATVQLSAAAEGIPFPSMDMMKDSKTGLQGACDAIIFGGSSNDPTLAGSRFISTPKNKLRIPGSPSSPMAEVRFLADIARYED